MRDLTDSIISPMLSSPLAESARTITSADHVKPQPTELVAQEELAEWEQRGGGWLNAGNARRLMATVRALQRDLAEARARLVEAQQLLEGAK